MVYVFLGQATAGTMSEYETGVRRPVLVFAQGETTAAAQSFAKDEMTSMGWEAIKFDKVGEVAYPDHDDTILKAAYETAKSGGCGIVVYREAVPPSKNNLSNA